jgi:hypothetical protein
MKSGHVIAVAVLACAGACATAQSAICRSEAAAIQGGQYGYNRDKNAAVENESRENASSELVGKCIGGITSVVVVPAFPSLGDIFSRAADKVCHVATARIRDAATLPSLPTLPGIPTTGIPVPVIMPAPRPTPVASGDFWSRIWR